MTTRRPPVIPEIAKAYENDPRTQIALNAIKAGGSTAPVAGGGWAIADGIARALQGVAGGYITKKQNEKYGALSDAKIAAMHSQGDAGLGGMTPPVTAASAAAPPAPVAPPPSPIAQAPAVAAALGAPPAPVAPAPGGAPQGRIPFGQGSGSVPISLAAGRDALTGLGARVTSGYRTPAHNAEVGGVSNSYHTRTNANGEPLAYDFVPPKGMSMTQLAENARKDYPGFKVLNEGDHVHVQPNSSSKSYASSPVASSVAAMLGAPAPQEAVPDMPAPVARPAAPEAIGPTQSKILKAAYQLMSTGDEFDYARAQAMLEKGLGDQTNLDESATERKQRITDMGYQTDLGQYSSGATADRNAAIKSREDVISHNRALKDQQNERQYTYGVHKEDQTFESAQEDKKLRNALTIEDKRAERIAGQPLDPDTLTHMAQQALEGDTTVYQGLGRGANGAQNTMALRKEMYRQGALLGLTPAQIASRNAAFFGKKAEARAIGARIGSTDVAASEVPGLAKEALRTHAAIPTTQLVPFNKAVQMVQSGTSSPELAAAVVANGAVVNAYARSFSSGVLSDRARKEASDRLSVAWGTPAYAAAVNQIISTIGKERSGAKASLDELAGKEPAPAPAPAAGGWGKATVVAH